MVTVPTQLDKLLPFKQRLEMFTIGEPLKSLFRPRFDVDYHLCNDLISVTLQMTAPDALERKEQLMATVVMQKEVRKPEEITARFLREMLHFMMLHEADESIAWEGKRIFDPHRYDKFKEND